MGSHESGRAENEVRSLLDALRRIVQVFRHSSAQLEREIGITTAQLFVLQRLDGAPARSVNDLAARTFTHQSSVSVVVSKLVERGLVLRRPSPEDARRHELQLTAAGRALLRRAPEAPQHRLAAAIERMAPSRRRMLTTAIAELMTETGMEGEPPMLFEDEPAGRARRK